MNAFEKHPILQNLYFINPFAWLIPAYRYGFLGRSETDTSIMNGGTLVVASILLIPVCFVIFVACYAIFKKYEYMMVEEV